MPDSEGESMLLNMTIKKTRKTHTAEFKSEALKLTERVGVAEAARQLKIYESQLYNWRTAIEKKSNVSQREAEQATEIAKLKRQLADQAEDLAILKKAQSNILNSLHGFTITLEQE
jgi:transposase